ncbi:MAG: T9SS type A sorting domain-containing protein, partial [Chryseosolibacter sp.]
KLYFLAVAPIPEGYVANNLWVSDGTEQGTRSLTASLQLDFTLIDPFITPFDGYVYFTGQTSTGVHIYRTDGTPEGEELFLPIVGKRLSSTAQLTVADKFLYYVSKGRLWRTDGENHFAINGVGTATEGSDPVMITDADGIVYFGAFDGTSHGLWKSDGTAQGTTLMKRFARPIRDLTISGNNLYCWATNETFFKLWKIDLISGESAQVSNINPGNHDFAFELTDVNGTLFFYVERLNYDTEIWLTTGTLESTHRVKLINTIGFALTELTNMNGTLFFAGAPNEVGPELWKSDGTEAGTVIVKRLNTNPAEPTAPEELTVVGNTLYFIGYNGYDYELYKTDGTADGTVMVKDVRVNDQFDNDITELTALNGMLYFASLDAFDQTTGYYTRAIWKTDGTDAGTVKVAIIDGIYDNPVINGVNILSAVDEDIIVLLQQDFYGTFELWKIDDTGNGSNKLSDLPGLQRLTSLDDNVLKDGVLYMSAHLSGNFPVTSQLWRTDGTACGTYVILEGASTADLTLSGDKIFVSAATPEVGSELFLLDAPAGAPCEDINSSSIVSRKTEERSFTERSINTYPNPFTTDFQLKIEGAEGGAFDVRVMDQYGNTLRAASQLLFNEEHMLGTDWAPGIYYLHMHHDGSLVSKKIVKRR